MESQLSKYEEELYSQIETLKKDLKFWQDRCTNAEQQLSVMTTNYNRVANELHCLKVKRQGVNYPNWRKEKVYANTMQINK